MKVPRNKMSVPNLSVIMAVRNGERHVAEAIDSILSQTMTGFELIVVDDASTDRTPEILAQYAHQDSRVRVLTNDCQRERSYSRNRAILEARGEYIAISDADDISAPDRLRIQYEALERDTLLGMVGTWVYEIDDDGETFGRITPPTESSEIRRRMLYKCVFWPCIMAKRTVLIESGLYDERLNSSEDYDLYLRVLDISDVANVPEFLLSYRLDWRSRARTDRYRRIQHLRVRYRAYRRMKVGMLTYASLILPLALYLMGGRLVVYMMKLKRAWAS